MGINRKNAMYVNYKSVRDRAIGNVTSIFAIVSQTAMNTTFQDIVNIDKLVYATDAVKHKNGSEVVFSHRLVSRWICSMKCRRQMLNSPVVLAVNATFSANKDESLLLRYI
jgi:hypothetical protein